MIFSLPVHTRALHRGGKLLLATLVFGVLCGSLPASAIQYGDGTYGACQFGSCSISLSSSGSVAVDVTPSSSGKCTVQKDVVSVLTDNSAGYTLSLANTSTNTALLHGAASIAATTATQASPTALTTNHWGYRVDSVGGFGAGPTSAQSNIAPSAALFAGVPASNAAANTIASTNAKANPAVTTNVWYGVCADTGITNGTYSSQVLYTAVAN